MAITRKPAIKMNTSEVREGIRWKMHSSSHFTAEFGGYVADLRLGGIYPMWEIFKDGLRVDVATSHHPVTSSCNKELAAKARIEKILRSIKTINPNE
jgi:hypothetical protein